MQFILTDKEMMERDLEIRSQYEEIRILKNKITDLQDVLKRKDTIENASEFARACQREAEYFKDRVKERDYEIKRLKERNEFLRNQNYILDDENRVLRKANGTLNIGTVPKALGLEFKKILDRIRKEHIKEEHIRYFLPYVRLRGRGKRKHYDKRYGMERNYSDSLPLDLATKTSIYLELKTETKRG